MFKSCRRKETAVGWGTRSRSRIQCSHRVRCHDGIDICVQPALRMVCSCRRANSRVGGVTTTAFLGQAAITAHRGAIARCSLWTDFAATAAFFSPCLLLAFHKVEKGLTMCDCDLPWCLSAEPSAPLASPFRWDGTALFAAILTVFFSGAVEGLMGVYCVQRRLVSLRVVLEKNSKLSPESFGRYQWYFLCGALLCGATYQ